MNQFEGHRKLLFSIAYRMLGTVMEAEDMVQETYLRWQAADQAAVENQRAYLVKTTTRLCIDYLKQARVRRERYVGEWLPEPLITADDHNDFAQMAESLSFAFLVMLETLTPLERAVFLLREVFDYRFDEIAAMVGKSVVNCRQILHRARVRVKDKRPRFDVDSAEQARLLATFSSACLSGDLSAVIDTLDQDIIFWSDGGGKVPAAQQPVKGAQHVGRLLLGLVRIAGQDAANMTTTAAIINGQPGLIVREAGQITTAFIYHIEFGRIRSIYAVRNPDKVRTLSAQS